jgi:hypothetical protein
MRTKLLIGSASAVVLVIAAVAFAGAFTNPQPTITQEAYICPVTGEELPCPLCCPYNAQAARQSTKEQACCPQGECCPECCTDACCFPALSSANTDAPKNGEACCTKPAAKTAKGCCADSCCK